MSAPRLDLDALAPPDRELVFRGVTYMLPGEVPMETVIAGVRMEADLRRAEEADDPDEQAKVLQSMYDTAMGLLRDRQPELAPLRFSTTEVSRIIAFATSGRADAESLEGEVLDALMGEQAEGDAGAEGGGAPPTAAESPRPKPTRSASAKRSLSPSSA